MTRQSIMTLTAITFFGLLLQPIHLVLADSHHNPQPKSAYNGVYSGEYLNRIAFPLGGIGAGMLCIEGTGAFSHVSVRNQM